MHKKILEAVRGCVLGQGDQGLHQLSLLSKQDDFLPELLNVAVPSEDSYSPKDEDVNLQAAIQFKNFLKQRRDAIPFQPLIMSVFSATPSVAKVLLAAIKENVKKGIEDQEFLGLVKSSLEQNNNPELGLAITRKVSGVYKNATSEAAMQKLMETLFPSIQSIMQGGLETFCKEAEDSFSSIFKIFANATFGSVGWYLRARKGETYYNWLQFHQKFLMAHPESKAAEFAMRSLCQQIQKYANYRFCPSDVMCFQKILMHEKWVVTLPINMWRSENPKILVLAIKSATCLLANPEARDLLLTEFDPLRFEADFALLSLTSQDSEVWESDPQQFLRRDASDSDIESPRSAMLHFLTLYTRPVTQESDEWRGKKKVMKVNSDILEAYMEKCVKILHNKDSDEVQIELALFLLGHLFEHSLFLDPVDYSTIAVNISVECLNLLECKKNLLVFRAAWLLGRFANSLKEESHPNVAISLSDLILSPNEDVLIKAQSAASIALYFCHGLGKDIKLQPLLQALLKLVKEVDLDGLFQALELLLFHARDRIEPYAEDLLNELLPRFKELAGSSNTQSQAACSVLDSIKVLLRGCKQAPDIFVKIETTLLEVVATMLSPEGSMYSEDGLELFSLILHYTPSIQQHHWEALPVLSDMICQKTPGGQVQPAWGFHLFPQMLYAFQNYVARDPDALSSGPIPPLDLIMELCSRVMELCFLKDGYDIECLVVSKIYITLIENTGSQFPLPEEDLTNITLDALRLIKSKEAAESQMNKIDIDNRKTWPSGEELKKQEEEQSDDDDDEGDYDRLKSVNLQILCLLCARDMKTLLQNLGSEEKLGFMLGELYDFLPNFKHHFELRRVLIGLAHILSVDFDLIPSQYVESMIGLFQRCLPCLFMAVKHQVREARPDLRKLALKEEEDMANPQAEEDTSIYEQSSRSRKYRETKTWRTIELDDSDDSSDDEENPAPRSSVFIEKGVSDQVKMDLKRIARDLGEQELADDDILEDYSVLYSSPIDTANEVEIFQSALAKLSVDRSESYLRGMSDDELKELAEAFETSKALFQSK